MPRHVALMSALLLALHASLASGRLLRAQGSATAHAAPPPPLPLVLATLPAAFLPINAAPEDAEPAGTVEMKIISGQPAPALPYAFMVALITESSFFCGGTLLDATTVLTAAHCVVDTNLVDNPDALEVWRIDGSTAQVAKIFAHPGYSASTIPNDNKDLTFNGNLHDVAVLKLAAPVADPIAVALPNATTVLPVGQQLQISGWGTTESGRASSVLLDADVKYLAPNQCPPDYDDVLCAGGTGENTCSGDSGGPLLLRDPEAGVATQFGVTSHGPDCLSGPALAYGYYTDVRKYLPAIESFRQGQQIAWDSSSDSSGGGGGPTFGSLGQGTAQLTDAAAGGEAPAPAPAPQNAGDVPSNWGFVEGTEAADASVGLGQGALDQIMCQVFSNC